MSTKSWYVLKSKAVPVRYGLSRNIQTLLHALDQYHMGGCDAAELGRLVRLSPKRRGAIADTITKCADRIKKEPEEVKTCVDIIEMCTEILEIADRPPPTPGFPLMRLPLEIREAIIDLMIDNVFRSPGILPVYSKTTCNCPMIERGYYPIHTPQMKALPSLLGPALNREFFRIFFRKKTFRFRCCCELKAHLMHNEQLVTHVRQIKVHWCGPESATAFKLLTKCEKLESLSVSISKLTMVHLSERTTLMKSFFPLTYRHVRITDALGLDELLDLRGLQEVAVTHVQSKSANLTVEMDRANLAGLLCNQLKKTKDEEDDST
ncbi:Fc.00g112410.m01.CDS01 [Cosmosporella sp. VM-42]